MKKGYSLLAHLLPFAAAALLLLVLSVPSDNLLLKLVAVLGKPQMWFPAILLTTVAVAVYLVSVYVEVDRAYFFQKRNRLRALLTCLLFMCLCTAMTGVVLRSASAKVFTPAGIWACVLVSALSLTGIGWTTPSKWIDALGLKHPDYTEAKRLSGLLTNALKSIRRKTRSDKGDVTTVLNYTGKLLGEIEKNIDCEPKWGKPEMQAAFAALEEFNASVIAEFSDSQPQRAQDFAQVMNCQRDSEYQTVDKLRKLSTIWRELQCDNP